MVCPPLPGPVGSVATDVDVIEAEDESVVSVVELDSIVFVVELDSIVSVVELGPWDVQVVFDHDV